MLAYCDYIADAIKRGLSMDIQDRPFSTYIKDIGPVKWDLHPTKGYMLSTAKTLVAQDINGKKYRITVEEIE